MPCSLNNKIVQEVPLSSRRSRLREQERGLRGEVRDHRQNQTQIP
jgi:hypothetical protein